MGEDTRLNQLDWILSQFDAELTDEEADQRVAQMSQILLVDYEDNPLFRSDPNALFAEIRSQAPRQVCQYAFRKNDIVWICKTCQKDETCVQCNNCYNDSDHKDHDVFFYHSQAGGCCDCGDPDAWDSNGFCTKHGKIAANPLDYLSANTREFGAKVLDRITSTFAAFAEEVVGQYSIQRLGEQHTDKVMLIIHADDSHRVELLIRHFQYHADELHKSDEQLKNELTTDGLLAEKVDMTSAVHRAQYLQGNSCTVRIATLQEWRKEQLLQKIVRWLYKVAEASDGFCRLVCNAFQLDYLVRIMMADCRLPKVFARALHDVFLTLMADQTFKMSVAQAYARSFEVFTSDYATCIGTNDTSLYTLSVQFLNRGSFVNEIVKGHMFLQSLSAALHNMLLADQAVAPVRGAGVMVQHPILAFRRYNPIIGDLKCIFTIPGISRIFMGLCLPQWLETLTIVQGIHPQQRMLAQHVEYETREWMDAFNLYLAMSSLFDYLFNWFGADDSATDLPTSVVILPSVQTVANQICQALQTWQDKCFEETWTYRVRTLQNGYIVYGSQPKLSFHLFLHRFLAGAIREAAKHPRHSGTLQAIFEQFKANDRQFMLTMDFPLADIVWAVQIKLGMWRKNGQVMGDQVLNYSEPPFCRVFRDLDLTVVQLCALALEPSDLLTHILFRYGIQDYVQNKSVDRSVDVAYAPTLLEEVLTFLAVLVNELPPMPSEDVVERVTPILRRELIHRLVSGPATYSQLQECLSLVPDHDKLPPGHFDEVLEAVAEAREGADLGPKKFYLREENWCYYDPSFSHISTHSHQSAIEQRPKLKKVTPIVPAPLEAHPFFAPLRHQFLCSPPLIELAQHMLAKYISQHPSASKLYDVPRAWPIHCTPGAFIHLLQLVTLQLHELQSLSTCAANARVKQEYFTCALEGLASAPTASAAVDFPTHDGFETEMASESLPSLLCCLLDVFDLLDSKEDVNIRFWLTWVLNCMREMDGRCEAVISERWQASEAQDRAAALEAKKKRAKNKAMKAMKASAAAFAAQAADFNLSDDEFDTNARDGDDDAKDSDEPYCIICHENNGQSLGYIALAQGSRLLSARDRRMRRANMDEPENQYKSAVDIHYQFCGHAIHFSCFSTYFVSVVSKSESQNGLILDTSAHEFQCPLCKGLANSLVPHSTHHHPRKRIRQQSDSADWFSRCVSLLNGHLSEEDLAEFARHNDHVAIEVRDSPNSLPRTETEVEPTHLEEIPEQKEDQPMSTSLPDESTLGRPGSSIRSYLKSRSTSGIGASNQNPGAGSARYSFSRFFRSRSLSTGADTTSEPIESATSSVSRTSRWLNFASEACAPRLNDSTPEETRLGEYIETLCSAVAFTISVEEVEDGLAHHLAAGFDKRDPLQMISKVVDAIGETLREFELGNVLWSVLRHKLEHGSCKGHSVSNLPGTWDWHTMQPLLCSNGLDLLVFALAFKTAVDDDNAFNIARELCIVKLAQLCVGGVSGPDSAATGHEDSQGVKHGQWANSEAQRCLVGINQLLKLTFEAVHRGNTLPFSSQLHPSISSIVHRWIIFVRGAVQVLHRCRPGAVQPIAVARPESAEATTWEDLLVHAALLHLPLPTADLAGETVRTAQVLYRTKFLTWLNDLGEDQRMWDATVQQAHWHYPAETRPKLIDLPDAYTSLHSEMYTHCDYEFPALCLACGSVLDANGKGQCTTHVASCSGSNGIVFLLQDCSILLLHGARACYYPAPYVDAHGERHRQFRGKPLFLDPRRYDLLQQLWAGHSIGREVVSKRSSSNRVIINSHY